MFFQFQKASGTLQSCPFGSALLVTWSSYASSQYNPASKCKARLPSLLWPSPASVLSFVFAGWRMQVLESPHSRQTPWASAAVASLRPWMAWQPLSKGPLWNEQGRLWSSCWEVGSRSSAHRSRDDGRSSPLPMAWTGSHSARMPWDPQDQAGPPHPQGIGSK